ncbi:MAG: hypothetical protein ACKO6N_15195, partial [Myxococcota bacterium]
MELKEQPEPRGPSRRFLTAMEERVILQQGMQQGMQQGVLKGWRESIESFFQEGMISREVYMQKLDALERSQQA